jgi:hypothetical protein
MRRPISLFALTLSIAGLATFDAANAQAAKKLFFEGDLVRGAQQGAPGPFCVLSNQQASGTSRLAYPRPRPIRPIAG